MPARLTPADIERNEAYAAEGLARRERAREMLARVQDAIRDVVRKHLASMGAVNLVAMRAGTSSATVGDLDREKKGAKLESVFAFADLEGIPPAEFIARAIGAPPPPPLEREARDPRIDAVGASIGAHKDDIEAAQVTRHLGRPDVTSDAIAAWLIEGQREARLGAERAAKLLRAGAAVGADGTPSGGVIDGRLAAGAMVAANSDTLRPAAPKPEPSEPAAERAPKSTRKPRGGQRR